MKLKVLALAGSMRRGSYNKQLIRYATPLLSSVDVTVVDLADYPLPLYDGDLEEAEGIPEKARKLRDLMQSHDAFLISSPEYNSSVAGTFKNAIDWISRPDGDVSALVAFQGKFAGLMSASPGMWGGMRGLVHLRSILQNIGVLTLPEQFTLSRAHEAFDKEGVLIDLKRQQRLQTFLDTFLASAQKFV